MQKQKQKKQQIKEEKKKEKKKKRERERERETHGSRNKLLKRGQLEYMKHIKQKTSTQLCFSSSK
jgi:hypothetical protein